MLRSSLHLIFTLLFIFRTKLFINNRISGKTSNILLNKHNTHTRNVGFFSHEHFSFVEEKQKLLQNKKNKDRKYVGRRESYVHFTKIHYLTKYKFQ